MSMSRFIFNALPFLIWTTEPVLSLLRISHTSPPHFHICMISNNIWIHLFSIICTFNFISHYSHSTMTLNVFPNSTTSCFSLSKFITFIYFHLLAITNSMKSLFQFLQVFLIIFCNQPSVISEQDCYSAISQFCPCTVLLNHYQPLLSHHNIWHYQHFYCPVWLTQCQRQWCLPMSWSWAVFNFFCGGV